MHSTLALAVAAVTASAAPAELDRKAIVWFPKEIQAASPAIAKRFDFARGVEYGYVYCTNLFGHPGDVHAVRIELGKAAVRPHIDEGALNPDKKARLRTTSAAAAGTKALFSVNGGFFSWSAMSALAVSRSSRTPAARSA